MVSDDMGEPIECGECGSTPVLCEKPTAESTYRITCDCDLTMIDVTDCVNDSNLMQGIGARWSNIDKDSIMDY